MVMIFAFACATMAHAGLQVQQSQSVNFTASVENNTDNSVPAAVKLTGFDDRGTVIGHLCQQAWLSEGRTTDVDFSWQAPAYATGVYWTSKVEVNGDCPNSNNSTYDDDHHDDDDDHHDDDDDHHDDDDDHHDD